MSNRGYKRHSSKLTGLTYRSAMELKIHEEFMSRGLIVEYEPREKQVEYLIPATKHRYLPDFILPNGIIVEAKGEFTPSDRKKHLFIQDQHPELDIRFVFQNAKRLLRHGSPTSYAKWCEKNGFQFAHRCIPGEWLKEPPRGSLSQGDKGVTEEKCS